MPDYGLHEPVTSLRPETIDRHRALRSLIEELEAIDWYDQRVDATSDAALAQVLAHNRDEEKEHAMMALEWLRRRDPVLDAHMRRCLFTAGDIVHVEVETEGASGGERSLGIGNLRMGGKP